MEIDVGDTGNIIDAGRADGNVGVGMPNNHHLARTRIWVDRRARIARVAS